MLAIALASLVVNVANMAHESMAAPEPGGHPYEVYWPKRAPTGMVVFLHGVSLHPFVEEGEGMQVLVRRATARGFIAVLPVGDRMCDFSPTDVERCWDLDSIADEVDSVRRIVADVEKRSGTHITEREIIGFSNGGFLVAGALQRGLLDGFQRVGIIAAGPVGNVKPPPKTKRQKVFIAVGVDDRWQGQSTRDLYGMFQAAALHVQFREVPGGHVFDGNRADDFLDWFWDD